jgi:hypothetical protein
MKILRIINIFLLSLFVLMVAYGLAKADTYAADNCTLAEVQSKVNDAARGDTVTVPACAETTWSDELDITKAIKLQGAGIDATNIKTGMTGGTGYSTSKFLIRYIPSSPSDDENELIEITGFTFNEDTKSGSILIRNDGTTNATPLRKVRIHHNKIINSFGTESTSAEYATSITIEGLVYGVIDNNTITGMMRVGAYGANYGNSGTSAWNYSNFNYGSADNMYWEDNTFTKNVSTDTRRSLYVYHDRGGRSVFRYNDFINSLDNTSYNGEGIYVIDTHGTLIGGTYPTATYRNRSTMGAEFYGNYINTTGTNVQVWGHRGGRFLSFWNYINLGTKSAVSIIQDEASEYYAPTNYECTGASFTDSEGLHTDYSSCSSDGGRQEQKKSYYFNNRKSSGALLNTKIVSANAQWGGNKLSLNSADASGYNQSDSCTATSCSLGVGCGSATPTGTCTTGTGYFKTALACDSLSSDNYGANPTTAISGTLYRCASTNNWQVYYTPYTYPHPLRSEVDTTAPTVSNISPTIEQACADASDPYTASDHTISLNTSENATCKWDTSVDADPTYAELSNTFDGTGTTSHTDTATLTCGQNNTIYYSCQDATPNTSSVSSWTFGISAGGDTDGPILSSLTVTNQSCSTTQLLRVQTSEHATCRYCKDDGDACTSATVWADRTQFTQTVDTVHHDVAVTQACSSTETYNILCQDTNGNESTNLAVSITTDAAKAMSITVGGAHMITLGSGGLSITVIP